MEAIPKERAARCNRATPVRKTGQPASGSHSQSISRKKRRAKYQRRRLALLLVLAAVLAGVIYSIACLAADERPATSPDTAAAQPSEAQAVSDTPAPSAALPSEAPVAAVRYELSADERDLVERVVMAEAGGECYEGQMLVAQCILNAAEKTGTEPSEAVETYQYTKTRPEPTQSVRDAVSAVFDVGETVTDELVMFFYNPARVTSAWHESQIFVTEVGGHRFFTEKEATP